MSGNKEEEQKESKQEDPSFAQILWGAFCNKAKEVQNHKGAVIAGAGAAGGTVLAAGLAVHNNKDDISRDINSNKHDGFFNDQMDPYGYHSHDEMDSRRNDHHFGYG